MKGGTKRDSVQKGRRDNEGKEREEAEKGRDRERKVR